MRNRYFLRKMFKKETKMSSKMTPKTPEIPTKPESDEERKAALFFCNGTASPSEFCWLLLVMRVPMFSGSFCR